MFKVENKSIKSITNYQMQTLLSTRPTANNNFAMPLPTHTRQKLTVETLERGMKYVRSLQKDTRDIFLAFSLLTLNIFDFFLMFLLLTLH